MTLGGEEVGGRCIECCGGVDGFEGGLVSGESKVIRYFLHRAPVIMYPSALR